MELAVEKNLNKIASPLFTIKARRIPNLYLATNKSTLWRSSGRSKAEKQNEHGYEGGIRDV